MNTQSSVHILTVNNDDAGRQVIAGIRSTLRKQRKQNPNFRFKVQCYGRGHRFGLGRIHIDKNFKPTRPNGWDNRYQSNLPHDKAERLAVYVTAGFPNGY